MLLLSYIMALGIVQLLCSLEVLGISLTSFSDFAGIGGGILSMLTGLLVDFFPFLLFIIGLIAGVYLYITFCLNEFFD